VMMWECLVGKPPFLAETYNTLIVEIMTGTRPLLRSVMPEAPASLEALLAQTYALKRDDRFASAAEFGAAIAAELVALGITATLDLRTSADFFFSKLPAPDPRTTTEFESSTTAAVDSAAAAGMIAKK
jgi:eukaryotic-like serine/threonine-protein kinase